jgi:hypothetical protein
MTPGEAPRSLALRILHEKRAFALPLALVLVVNVGVYALVVYPLSVRSAGARDRAEAAAASLRSAERDEAAARELVAGKARADEELSAFYQKVLPPDLSAARRLTYARLPALARKADVLYAAGKSDIEASTDRERLGRLRTTMTLQGEYENIRRFVYELETAPEFVILDDVTLVQPDSTRPLTLTIELSTYYRREDNGA